MDFMKLKNWSPQKVEIKNNMKKTIKRNTSLVLLALVMIFTQSPMALAAANLNNDPQDRPTLRVTNYSSNPDCNQCWSSNVNVAVGEIASFIIYYHNTGQDTATNVRTRISTSISGDGRTVNATGNVWADNAGLVSGSASVTLPSGSKATSLTHLATVWRPNQTTSGSAALPSGQSGADVYSGSGLNIGNINSGWPSQGSVVVRYRIEGTKDASISDGPSVTTFSATGIDRESAQLRGEANPRGESTRVWFEWGRSSSNLNRETSDQSIGSSNRTTEFSASIGGLDPDTTYFYRALARNSFGTVRGDIKVLDTLSDRRVDRPTVRVLAASNISTGSANIRGEVSPNENRTDTWFEWGTNPNNLTARTGALSVGSGSGFTNVSSFLSGLGANTTYYYRVAAQNNAGTSFSAIENFRTNTVFIPPVSSAPAAPEVITRVVRVVQGEATVPAEQSVKFTLEADKSEISKSRIIYFVNYGNLTNGTLRDGVIEVNLPDKLEFVDSDRQVSEVRDKTLVFRLGAIRSGDRGRIEIKTKGTDLKEGGHVTVAASLSYLNGNNIRYIVSATDITEITKADSVGGGLTATILDALKEFLTNPIFWLLIVLLLLYFVYRFLTARRQPPIYPPAGGTAAMYPPMPPTPIKPSEQAGELGAPMYPVPPRPPISESLPPPRTPEGPPFG